MDFKDIHMLEENSDNNSGKSLPVFTPLFLPVTTKKYSVTCNTKLFLEDCNFHKHVYLHYRSFVSYFIHSLKYA